MVICIFEMLHDGVASRRDKRDKFDRLEPLTLDSQISNFTVQVSHQSLN
jgi:hypothetical protein